MKLKSLLIIFGVVVIAFVVFKMSDDKSESTLKSDLVGVDTSAISNIYIYPLTTGHKEVILTKEDGEWKVDVNGKLVNTESNTIQSMLIELTKLRPKKLASRNKDHWMKYEVADSLGTRIKIESDGEIVSDLVLGRFDYDQEKRIARTFVRESDEVEVYMVDGYVSMSFNRDASQFRDRAIIQTSNEGWKQISYNYPGDSSFVMQNNNGYWMIDGLVADSMTVTNYVNSLSALGGSGFLDNFDVSLSQPLYSIIIEGANTLPITLEAFPYTDGRDFAIVSSENKDSKFSGLEGDLLSRVFVNKSKFFPQSE